jgi:2,3-bisphosphoglycerate-dependent phosphoglycerate mutase
MSEIIHVRHAASSGQAPDAPLTAAGLKQAHVLAELLSTLAVERIASSPYRRALQTVEPFRASAALDIELDARLVEQTMSAHDLPDWRDQLRESFNDLDRRLEGGESSREARARGLAALNGAVASGQRTVLVSHGKLLTLLLSAFDPSVGYDVWEKLSNPDVFVVQVRERSFRRIWTA